mmetsp:Transcript_29388/g.63404  ORF Transcript_29388/g.63404 Transcript_29388/m.63404 type:complete len:305 (-) Transcript_29388:18-932(-)
MPQDDPRSNWYFSHESSSYFLVQAVAPHGPASQVEPPVMENDRLISVDGVLIGDISYEELSRLIRGEQGSYVELVLQRDISMHIFQVKIRRGDSSPRREDTRPRHSSSSSEEAFSHDNDEFNSRAHPNFESEPEPGSEPPPSPPPSGSPPPSAPPPPSPPSPPPSPPPRRRDPVEEAYRALVAKFRVELLAMPESDRPRWYRRKAREFHPDKRSGTDPDDTTFKALQEAWDSVRDAGGQDPEPEDTQATEQGDNPTNTRPETGQGPVGGDTGNAHGSSTPPTVGIGITFVKFTPADRNGEGEWL